MPRCQPKLNFWKTRWKCTVCGARRPFNAQTQTLATIHHECGRPKPYAGPGTQLKRMLAKLGLKPEPGCPCLSRAAEMDRRGVPWCAENIDTILGWLKEESDRRGLPFAEFVARMLIKRAIGAARRAGSLSEKAAATSDTLLSLAVKPGLAHQDLLIK